MEILMWLTFADTMLEIDLRPAINNLRQANRNLSPKQFNTAIARALNRSVTSGRAQVVKEVRERYNIKSTNIRNDLTLKRANPGKLTSAIVAIGRPIPIEAFNPRFTKSGVTVNILGERKKIERAFKAVMQSGHSGVYARGKYTKGKGSKFEFRKKRGKAQWGKKFITYKGNRFPIDKPDLPINELYTLSVPAAMGNENVLPKIGMAVEKIFEKRLIHELKFIQSTIGNATV